MTKTEVDVKRPIAKLFKRLNASAKQLDDLCRVSMDSPVYGREASLLELLVMSDEVV